MIIGVPNIEPRRSGGVAVSDEALEQAYVAMALLLEHDRERLLPIFERLHRERQIRIGRDSLFNIARSVTANRDAQKL